MRARALPAVMALAVVVSIAAGCGSSDPVCDPLTNASCIPNLPACSNPIGVSEAAAGQVLLHAADTRVGTTLGFDVPVNTASITVVEQAVKAPAFITYRSSSSASPQTIDNLAVPFWIRDPATNLVYDDNQDFGQLSSTQVEQLHAYAAGVGPAIGTITIPNTTGGFSLLGSTGQPGLPAGRWQMQVSDLGWECTLPQGGTASCTGGTTASLYDVTVIAKAATAGGAIPSTGAVDLAIYFATNDNGTLSAASANAGSDGDLNRMVLSLTGLLGKAGVTVRSKTFKDLPANVQQTYAAGVDISATDACSPLADLLKYGQGGQTLNVFLVSAFTGADLVAGKSVVGLDGTIPGPASIGGSSGSGVAVSTVDLRSGHNSCQSGSFSLGCGADLTAYYVAHEAGHYLGLYHTTEMNGLRFDPLAGTPTCPCSTCKTSSDLCATSTATADSSSHTMTVTECTSTSRPACGGGDNLMFWTLGNVSKGNLTTDQKSVILANPLVQ